MKILLTLYFCVIDYVQLLRISTRINKMNGFISEIDSLKEWKDSGAYEFFNLITMEQLKAFIALSRRKKQLDFNYEIALKTYESRIAK